MAIVKSGDFITITERRCSDKVQPHIELGGIYHVRTIEKTSSGVDVLVLDRDVKKGTTVRCNSQRFRWKRMTQRELDESVYAGECRDAIHRFVEKFTPEEYIRIAYIPLMIGEISWIYAERTAAQAASERIDIVKALSRTVRELRTHYIAQLRKSLDVRIITSFQNHAKQFIEERGFDFFVLETSVFNGIGFQHPHIEYQELRKLAFISMMFIDFCRDYEEEQDKVIKSRLGMMQRRRVPFLTELKRLMDAYLGDFPIVMNDNMSRAMKVFRNNMDASEFEIANIDLITNVWKSVWADKK